MNVESFLESGWNDHADRPQEVADRLSASLNLVQTPENLPSYARLVTHVFGEHLGQWERGVDLLESLRRMSAFDGGPAVEGAVARGVATLRYAGGDSAALESLGIEDRVTALAGAASAFTGRGAGDSASFEASRQGALELLEQVPPDELQWCESVRNELGG